MIHLEKFTYPTPLPPTRFLIKPKHVTCDGCDYDGRLRRGHRGEGTTSPFNGGASVVNAGRRRDSGSGGGEGAVYIDYAPPTSWAGASTEGLSRRERVGVRFAFRSVSVVPPTAAVAIPSTDSSPCVPRRPHRNERRAYSFLPATLSKGPAGRQEPRVRVTAVS